jgi:TRAP-type uncharacterized transport system substrate-binding protein
LIRFVGLGLALGVVVAAVIYGLPPRSVTIEVGPVDGSYDDIALQYRQALRNHGIKVKIKSNPDSVQIVNDVDRDASHVDIGFTAQPVKRDQFPNTAAAGTIELEPLFIFCRTGLGEIRTLANVRGMRVVMPARESATSEAALNVLSLYGITEQNTPITSLPLAEAVRALKAGQFDAGFFMLAPSNAFIAELLTADNLRLLNMTEAKGVMRQLPFLRTVVLPRDSYSVEHSIPPTDVQLLAATVNVVVRKDIHPAVLYTLLDAMNELHHGATLISDLNAFPSIDGTDLVPHPLAVTYFKSGMPWTFRNLPLPLASLVDAYLVVGIMIFLVTQIYQTLKYLSELFDLVVERLCLRVLLRIERAAQSGKPASESRRFIVRAIERAMSYQVERERREDLLHRIRRHVEPNR